MFRLIQSNDVLCESSHSADQWIISATLHYVWCGVACHDNIMPLQNVSLCVMVTMLPLTHVWDETWVMSYMVLCIACGWGSYMCRTHSLKLECANHIGGQLLRKEDGEFRRLTGLRNASSGRLEYPIFLLTSGGGGGDDIPVYLWALHTWLRKFPSLCRASTGHTSPWPAPPAWIVTIHSTLYTLTLPGQHHYGGASLFPDHPPEVCQGLGKRALGRECLVLSVSLSVSALYALQIPSGCW